jgi:hypothetical protein
VCRLFDYDVVAPAPWSPVVGRNGGRLSPTEAIVNAVKTLSHFLNASGAPPAAEDPVDEDATLPPAMLQVRAVCTFFLASTDKCVWYLRTSEGTSQLGSRC